MTSVRTEKKLRSSPVFAAFGASGCQKLGQPVPDSNFVSELKSGRSQHTQTYVPFAWLSQFGPVKARSVPFFRVTVYCSGVRSAFHSASVFTIRSGRRSAASAFGIADPFWAGLFSGPAEPIATSAPAPARRGRVTERKSRRLMITSRNAFWGRIIPSDLLGGRPKILEGHPDAIRVRPKTQDAHADREVLFKERARQEDPLPGVHAVHELPVQAIHFRARRGRCREAESEEGQLRLGHDRHAGDPSHGLDRLLGKVELLVERRAEGSEAAEFQREPDPEAAKVPRELGRDLAEVHRVWVVLHAGHVVRGDAVRAAERSGVLHEETAGAVWHEQALVRIEHDRVGVCEAEERRVGKECRSRW